MNERFEIHEFEIEIHERTALSIEDQVDLIRGDFWFESGKTKWTVNKVADEVVWPKSALVLNCMIQLPDELKTDRPTSWLINNSPHFKELVRIDGCIYAPELIDAFYGKHVADYIRANRIKPYPSVIL